MFKPDTSKRENNGSANERLLRDTIWKWLIIEDNGEINVFCTVLSFVLHSGLTDGWSYNLLSCYIFRLRNEVVCVHVDQNLPDAISYIPHPLILQPWPRKSAGINSTISTLCYIASKSLSLFCHTHMPQSMYNQRAGPSVCSLALLCESSLLPAHQRYWLVSHHERMTEPSIRTGQSVAVRRGKVRGLCWVKGSYDEDWLCILKCKGQQGHGGFIKLYTFHNERDNNHSCWKIIVSAVDIYVTHSFLCLWSVT